MPSSIVLVLAVAAVATGSLIGGATIVDMGEFDLEIKVVDATTGAPVAGANVAVTDANGLVVAQGVTDEDGEFDISVDDHGVDEQGDDDDQGEDNDDQDDINEAIALDVDDENETDDDEATLNSIAGPLTVTISADGYVTQTIGVDVNTLEDEDLKVELQPVA